MEYNVEFFKLNYWYFAIFSFIFGAAIGSFLNVVIYRLPIPGLSIVKPRSKCPNCDTPIAGYDNIPILSWFLLRGRCRHCGEKFSFRYAGVETLTGCVAVLFFHMTVIGRFSPAAGLIFFLFACALIAITFIDLDHMIIPNQISIPGIPIGIVLSIFLPVGLLGSVIGAAVGFVSTMAVVYGSLIILKKEGMGLGDVKLLTMIGAFVGWQGVLMTWFIASLVGSVVGIFTVVIPGKGRNYRIPFGPFLSAGAVIYILGGDQLIRWYIELFGG